MRPARSLALPLILLSLCCSIQGLIVHAESPPALQEGLALEYEMRGVWNDPAWGSGEYSYSGTVKIRVQNTFDDTAKISYEGSFKVAFPPQIESSKIDAFNLDGTTPVLSTHGSTKERYWSFTSTVTLKGRSAIATEGDHVDVVMARGYKGGKIWAQWALWVTYFPLNYPTTVFLSPGLSPGDQVPSFKTYDWYSGKPKVRDSTFSISRVETRTTPFGNQETLVSETQGVKQVEENAWDSTQTCSWDRGTGILIENAQADKLVKDGRTYTIDYRFRLLKVQGSESPKASITDLLEVASKRKETYDSLAAALDPASALQENIRLWGETQVKLWSFTAGTLHGMAQGSLTATQKSALQGLINEIEVVNDVITLGKLFNEMTDAVGRLDEQAKAYNKQLFLEQPQFSKLRSDLTEMSSLISKEINAIKAGDKEALRLAYQEESEALSSIRLDLVDVKHILDDLITPRTVSVAGVSETYTLPSLKKDQTWETEVLLDLGPEFVLVVSSHKINPWSDLLPAGERIRIEMLDKTGRVVEGATVEGPSDISVAVPVDILYVMQKESIYWQDGKVYFKIRLTVLNTPKALGLGFLWDVDLKLQVTALMRPAGSASYPTEYQKDVYNVVQKAVEACDKLLAEEEAYVSLATALLD